MHKFRIVLATVAGCIFLLGCAAPTPRIIETPSGKAEGVFIGQTPAQASNQIAGLCASRPKVSVPLVTDRMVECRAVMEGGSAIYAQLMLGNSYSTIPEAILQFTLVEEGANTRAYGDVFVETIMAYGQPRRVKMQDNDTYNTMLEVLWKAGAKKPNISPKPTSETQVAEQTVSPAIAAAATPTESAVVPTEMSPTLAPLPTQTQRLPGHRLAAYGCPGFAPRVLYSDSPEKLPKNCQRVEPL